MSPAEHTALDFVPKFIFESPVEFANYLLRVEGTNRHLMEQRGVDLDSTPAKVGLSEFGSVDPTRVAISLTWQGTPVPQPIS